MADRIASVKNAVNAAEIAIRRAEVSAELSKKAATDALDVQLVTICEASHLLPNKAPVTPKSDDDNTIDIRWLLFVVFVSAVACGFAISFGYTMWPSINEGCQPYNCSWAPDWTWSYCSNGTCQYFWRTIVDGNLPGGTGGLPLAGVVVPAQIQLMYIPPTIPRINHIPMGHCATNHHIATPLRTALGFKVGTVSRCLVVLILFGLLVDCGLCAQRALFSGSFM